MPWIRWNHFCTTGNYTNTKVTITTLVNKTTKGMNVSRQVKWQQKMLAEGRCIRCGIRGQEKQLCNSCAAKKGVKKRHICESQWEVIDWSKTNRQIAAELGVNYETVRSHRPKRKYSCEPALPNHKTSPTDRSTMKREIAFISINILLIWYFTSIITFRARHQWASETECFLNSANALMFRKIEQPNTTNENNNLPHP